MCSNERWARLRPIRLRFQCGAGVRGGSYDLGADSRYVVFDVVELDDEAEARESARAAVGSEERSDVATDELSKPSREPLRIVKVHESTTSGRAWGLSVLVRAVVLSERIVLDGRLVQFLGETAGPEGGEVHQPLLLQPGCRDWSHVSSIGWLLHTSMEEGVRWKTHSSCASHPGGGMHCAAVAPGPMMPTRLSTSFVVRRRAPSGNSASCRARRLPRSGRRRSVSRILFPRSGPWSFLWAARYRTAQATHPRVRGPRVPYVRSCSGWGLPRARVSAGAGDSRHRFTDSRTPGARAVSFLWHFPPIPRGRR